MNKPGRTFHTANSKQGRKIAAASSPIISPSKWAETQEVRDWNNAVDEKNKQRLRDRLAKKGITA